MARIPRGAWSVLGVLLLVAVAAVVVSPGLREWIRSVLWPVEETRVALHPECPGHPFRIIHYEIGVAADDTLSADTLDQLPNAGVISKVPEYHDCQKLAEGSTPKYVSLVGVFAYEALGSAYANPAQPPANLRAAAEIVNFDHYYRPLGLEVGFSCLYLWPEGQSWHARLFPAGGTPDLCTRVLGDWNPADGHPLRVERSREERLENADYPPVARWDWDPQGNHNFVSIRCGDAWCEVRPQVPLVAALGNLDKRPPDVVVPDPKVPPRTPRWNRVATVRGWYDEQRLAVPSGSGLQFSEIVAAIVPHPDLGTRTLASEYDGAWLEVARIELDAAPGTDVYRTKLGLEVGTNIVEMQRFAALPTDLVTGCKADLEGNFWVASIRQDGGRAAHRCVERVIHTDMPESLAMPGTARWRWDPNDEKTWVQCPQGCCTIH
ncbi:MAG: hypothetical protein ACREMH_04335 [Gemmatimonadales bacterium]